MNKKDRKKNNKIEINPVNHCEVPRHSNRFPVVLSETINIIMKKFEDRPAEELKAFMWGLQIGLGIEDGSLLGEDGKSRISNPKDIVLFFDTFDAAMDLKMAAIRKIEGNHRLTVKELFQLADVGVFPPESTCKGWTNSKELDVEVALCVDGKVWKICFAPPRYIGYSDLYNPDHHESKRRK